jgi:hypothetical protein
MVIPLGRVLGPRARQPPQAAEVLVIHARVRRELRWERDVEDVSIGIARGDRGVLPLVLPYVTEMTKTTRRGWRQH